MGFSTVAAQAIFFIVVILAAVSLSAVFISYMDATTAATGLRSRTLIKQMSTDIVVTDVVANATNFTVSLRNVGDTILVPNLTDVFISGAYVSRSNRTVYVEASTDTRNSGLWDPYERLIIKGWTLGNHRLTVGQTYEMKVEEEHGISATYEFVPSDGPI
ncbi:hypothetical protein DRN74_01400 [Candidatus Micrarchaeota archaeon]|nr:MAG: hypothetical protein DRN74_01400 [Candidatus Micrarchaeota archaeon]